MRPSEISFFRRPVYFNPDYLGFFSIKATNWSIIALNKAARGFDELAVVVKQGRRVAEEHFRLAGQRHIEIRKGKAQIFFARYNHPFYRRNG